MSQSLPTPNQETPTDEDIEAAIRRGQESREPGARAVMFDAAARRVTLVMTTGVTIGFDLAAVPELTTASDNELGRLELSPSGSTLSLRALDVDISVAGLLLDLLGAAGWKAAIRSELNREAGRITNEARARASRENGTRGGRPKKNQPAVGSVG